MCDTHTSGTRNGCVALGELGFPPKLRLGHTMWGGVFPPRRVVKIFCDPKLTIFVTNQRERVLLGVLETRLWCKEESSVFSSIPPLKKNRNTVFKSIILTCSKSSEFQWYNLSTSSSSLFYCIRHVYLSGADRFFTSI